MYVCECEWAKGGDASAPPRHPPKPLRPKGPCALNPYHAPAVRSQPLSCPGILCRSILCLATQPRSTQPSLCMPRTAQASSGQTNQPRPNHLKVFKVSEFQKFKVSNVENFSKFQSLGRIFSKSCFQCLKVSKFLNRQFCQDPNFETLKLC